ncbi:hypothetical protein [Haliangium ochraceum]|uniref:Uncharacterized protein n=1 Tax=Haliangium ochraceum (strain DSM 14365 / JCM 11303 / SMP-2) TaxID=502025 RepID=D0LV24_HALO1|nr:hypothetical protein [Haliangium ochraceum]ACY15865.1 hypothetical protein Hoch_3363 [Haliangium ochraceum DSM 14365]
MPSSAHIIYIPAMILVGVMLGFILGSRAARNAFDMERKRDAERAEARARREERKRARQAAADAEAGGQGEAGADADERPTAGA